MSKQTTNGWIYSDDFVQIYGPDFGWEVDRWLHVGGEVKFKSLLKLQNCLKNNEKIKKTLLTIFPPKKIC
jgi:hypothetical protein